MTVLRLYDDLVLATDREQDFLTDDGWTVFPLLTLSHDRKSLTGAIRAVLKAWRRGRKVALTDYAWPSERCQGVAAAACYAANRGSSVPGITEWICSKYKGVPFNFFINQCEFSVQDMTRVILREDVSIQNNSSESNDDLLHVLVPPGIGDSLWAMTKIPALLKQHDCEGVHVHVAVTSDLDLIQMRALPFLRRFDFVRGASLMETGGMHPPGVPQNDAKGRYNYLPDGDGVYGGRKVLCLMPNGPLERGIRLEDWLPDVETDWNVMRRDFLLSLEEMAQVEHEAMCPYVVCYLGPQRANVPGGEGHNRGGIWTPEDWIAVGEHLIKQHSLNVFVVGADYDRSYWRDCVQPLVEHVRWHDLIGKTSVGLLMSLLRRAKLCLSFQSGIGISAVYLGTPTCIFWRSEGNSLNADRLVSFSEAMATAWMPPEMISRCLPAIYGRTTAEDVCNWADSIIGGKSV